MSDNWWKVLAVVFLVYAFVFGLGVPLRQGIFDVNIHESTTGELLNLEVTGYNSNYDQAQKIRAWLRMDKQNAVDGLEEFLIEGKVLEVLEARKVKIRFDIPEFLPTTDPVKSFSLIIDSDADGVTVLPDGIFIQQKEVKPERAILEGHSGLLVDLNNEWRLGFPYRPILYETIRNTYFHVALWFAMLFFFMRGIWFGTRYLRRGFQFIDDAKAMSFTLVGLLFGTLGLITGAIWAKYTWGSYWSNDVKQVTTAIALLIYLAYFVLRGAFDDPQRKGRIAAVYSIFAFVALLALLYVVPRMTASLHPGNGGNPAFGSDDLDNTMRLVFYPAIIGWTLLGSWMANIHWRMLRLGLHYDL